MAVGLTVRLFLAFLLAASVLGATIRSEAAEAKSAAHYDRLLEEHCGTTTNHILRENCKVGAESAEWDVNGPGDASLVGFADDISYAPGGLVQLRIRTEAASYRVDVYRLGYYRGRGARLVDWFHVGLQVPPPPPPPPPPPHSGWQEARSREVLVQPTGAQPPCLEDAATGLYDCSNWHVSASWRVPEEAVTGLYVARLVRTDKAPPPTWRTDASPYRDDPLFATFDDPFAAPFLQPPPLEHSYGAQGLLNFRHRLKEPRASHVYFVVRPAALRPQQPGTVLFQTPDTTWYAYNTFAGVNDTSGSFLAGRSMYGSFVPTEPRPRSVVRSYNSPLVTRRHRPVNAPLGATYAMIRFLERQGYLVDYWTGVDVDRFGAELSKPKRVGEQRYAAYLSVGHDEYWSGAQRRHVEAARDAGVHLMFLSGNEVFWKVRWENRHRHLVCYKDSEEFTKTDPSSEWTGTFRDSRPLNPEGPWPENSLTGTIFTANAWRNDPLIVSHRYSKLRFWRHTAVAKLREGETAVFNRGLLAHEFDSVIDNGFSPAGLFKLSSTVVDNVMSIVDFGRTYDTGSAEHNLVMYRAPSGALVFGAGTVHWAYALDDFHDDSGGIPAHIMNPFDIRVGADLIPPDRDLQQAQVNVMADMGLFPGSLDVALERSVQSADFSGPVVEVVLSHLLTRSLQSLSLSLLSLSSGKPAQQSVSETEREDRKRSELDELNSACFLARAVDRGGGEVGAVHVAVRFVDLSRSAGLTAQEKGAARISESMVPLDPKGFWKEAEPCAGETAAKCRVLLTASTDGLGTGEVSTGRHVAFVGSLDDYYLSCVKSFAEAQEEPFDALDVLVRAVDDSGNIGRIAWTEIPLHASKDVVRVKETGGEL